MVMHNIPPLFNKESKILILGSFPSVKSREAEFFYGHPQNRFWRVMEGLFDVRDLNETEDKRAFLLEHRIAVWDVIASCTIKGSADDTIEKVVANDLSVILDAADIRIIYVNGNKAFELYETYIKPGLTEKYGRLANAVRLPSTSPANAAWSLAQLSTVWERILTGLELNRMGSSCVPAHRDDLSGSAHGSAPVQKQDLSGSAHGSAPVQKQDLSEVGASCSTNLMV